MTEERKNSLTPLRRRREFYFKKESDAVTRLRHILHTLLHTHISHIHIHNKNFLGILKVCYFIVGLNAILFQFYPHDIEFMLL